MNRLLLRLVAIAVSLGGLVLALLAGPVDARDAMDEAYRPELAYLKQVNSWRPPADPQLLLLLMGQYANANRHAEGAAYLDALRRRFDHQLNDTQRALYLTAVAALRAGHANDVFLLRRIDWMRDTLAMLDDAKRLTGGEMFIARWMSGIVRSQVPGVLGERDTAVADLQWCLAHSDRAMNAGWLREVHFHLATVYRARGDLAQAQQHQAASGYSETQRPVLFTTPFSGDAASGHQFSPRAVRELVPETVYQLSGFEFTEYYFVISADRKELIAIDAGTRPDAAREAHAALRARVPGLPPLTTVIITHAHWDHVGGQRYFRGLNPAPRFIGRANYGEELAHDAKADRATLQRFFGQGFSLDEVLAYRPDVAIDRPTDTTIGGTRLVLLPARGGETDDALLIQMPEQGVLFVGDILMPYFGAPFIEEGSVDGMLSAIDQVNALKPRMLLHGHEPLTRLFDSTRVLAELRPQLAWLRDRVVREVAQGTPRASLQQANLTPPTLEAASSSVHLAYLVMRENLINRVFDQQSGYWQNGLKGLDALSDADHGAALLDYLRLDDGQLSAGAERMMADGRHELAAVTLRHALARRPASPTLRAAYRIATLKLMEQVQEFNPFKFILYGQQIDESTAQMGTGPAVAPDAR
jgi:glyoxylase-like metal-dependent hydrolase (beta-lactamase superfamily II)